MICYRFEVCSSVRCSAPLRAPTLSLSADWAPSFSIKLLNYKRLELVFIVHEISIRVPEFKFPVIRKESSELDQEEICKATFGPLSAAFHQKCC